MTYTTIEFDSNGNPHCASTYDGDELAEMSANEIVCTVAQYADWQNCMLIDGQIVAAITTTPSAKATANAAIQMQIDALEKGQARVVREAAMGTADAADRLKALDSKIVALRLQFVGD